MTPSIERLINNAKLQPHLCARCAEPKHTIVDVLIAKSEDCCVVMERVALPVCLECLLSLLALPSAQVVESSS